MEDIMQNVSIPRRPLGITIIAIILFIQAIFEIVVGIFAFFANIIRNPVAGLLVGWLPLAIGILVFILAWGLWTLRPWAYWATLILEIVNIVLHFLGYQQAQDRKSTRLNSSHANISYAVFCLKKKKM